MSIQYFIPDWDDRVDPGYNFLADTSTPGRHPYRDDRYAHEIYGAPTYDGLLLSRAVVDANPSKRSLIDRLGSVHHLLRWPQDGRHLVLGDCGAFSYWRDETPPYESAEMLEYYQALGFDLGVAIDHLIFAELDAERDRRWDLTMTNAEQFLRLHRSGGYRFTPIGVAQGWSPESYRQAVHDLLRMGYTYIALGGLVRSQTSEIIRILRAVQPELRHDTQVHLFGVSRPEYVPTFARLGVTSFDSASRLRRAWMDGKNNYFLGDTAYTAIRVPDYRTTAKKHALDLTQTRTLEQSTLAALRALGTDSEDASSAAELALAYAALNGDVPARTRADYERTIRDRPWQRCPCEICRSIGVEVIIFRGNNRNRRRGFHNTWQLYNDLQAMRWMAHSVDDDPIVEERAQLELDL